MLEIRKRVKPPNLVMKVYITKAYDRLEWLFLTNVLRNIGFCEEIIGMVYRLVANNLYSILLMVNLKDYLNPQEG